MLLAPGGHFPDAPCHTEVTHVRCFGEVTAPEIAPVGQLGLVVGLLVLVVAPVSGNALAEEEYDEEQAERDRKAVVSKELRETRPRPIAARRHVCTMSMEDRGLDAAPANVQRERPSLVAGLSSVSGVCSHRD